MRAKHQKVKQMIRIATLSSLYIAALSAFLLAYASLPMAS
jgi:hypothetical protein